MKVQRMLNTCSWQIFEENLLNIEMRGWEKMHSAPPLLILFGAQNLGRYEWNSKSKWGQSSQVAEWIF